MRLEERVYSVLIVSASQKFTDTLSAMLPASDYDPVNTASDVASAKRAVAARDYDIVMINSPVRDDPGVRFATDAGASGSTAVLMIAAEDICEEINARVAGYGVFTLSRPVSAHMMTTALRWLRAALERSRISAKKAVSLEDKMEEIRLVNRAKWMLIEKRGMDEPSAHRYIEKRAMDLCVTKRAVAEETIEELKSP